MIRRAYIAICAFALCACTQDPAPVMDHSAADYSQKPGTVRTSFVQQLNKPAPQPPATPAQVAASIPPLPARENNTPFVPTQYGNSTSAYYGYSSREPGKNLDSLRPVSHQVESASFTKKPLIWPVNGKVISGFGPKSGGLANDGVNIAAKEGASVRAAAAGKVAYVGHAIAGYGNMVLIRHQDGKSTTYAHLAKITVKKGAQVRGGEVIGQVGRTGNVASAQLHFGVHAGKKAVDPLKFLPQTALAEK